MSSPSNMNSPLPHSSPLKAEQSAPQFSNLEALISLHDHLLSGLMNEGSISDLQFRPNASFYPIRDVSINKEYCTLTFDRPLRHVDRPVRADEILLLIQNIKRGERDLALGQGLFLYPSKEAFGLNQSGELVFVLRNIRPKLTYQECGEERLNLLAFLSLIETNSPQLWHKLSPIRHQLENLNQLEEALQGSTWFEKMSRGLWRLCLYALFLWLISIPVAAFGPPQVQEPLKKLYYPVFERLTVLMSPAPPSPELSTPSDSGSEEKMNEPSSIPVETKSDVENTPGSP